MFNAATFMKRYKSHYVLLLPSPNDMNAIAYYDKWNWMQNHQMIELDQLFLKSLMKLDRAAP